VSHGKNWKQQVEEAVSNPVRVGGDNVFFQTIQEFVGTLDKSPFMRAELTQSPDSKIHTLFVWPKYRRDLRSAMLGFWITPSGVTVLGSNQQELSTPEALTDYFVKFATQTAFPQTVQEFARLTEENVYATLHTTPGRAVEPGDVVVIVSAADQKKLAEAAEQRPGAALDLKVQLETENPLGKFRKDRAYPFLESGGYGLWIVPPIGTIGKGLLVIKGTVLDLASFADAA
jgi:hypothetical protein